jgi:hypothetical protein
VTADERYWESLAPIELDFLRSILQTTTNEILHSEQQALHYNEAHFLWYADELRSLVNQLISVGTFAVIEGHARHLTQRCGIEPRRRAAWGEIRKGLESFLGQNLELIKGFPAVETVRRLSNCFKHSGGWPSPEILSLSGHPDPPYLSRLIQRDPLNGKMTFWSYVEAEQNLDEARLFSINLSKNVESALDANANGREV